MNNKKILPLHLNGLKNIVYLPFDSIFHFYMSLPDNLRKKDINEYVLHRLPKIYPGDISEIDIDIRLSFDFAEVFIISRETVSLIRDKNVDCRFTSLISIMQPLSYSFIRIVCCGTWYEKAEYFEGKWLNFVRESYENSNFLNEYNTQNVKPVQVLCNDKEMENFKKLSNKML